MWTAAVYHAPVPIHRADSACVDHNFVRVPDIYCPIGDYDGPSLARGPYGWVYHEYDDGFGQPYAMPYVGYPVERSVFVDRRPVNVTTLNIRRGAFAEKPPAGKAGSASQVEPVGYENNTRVVDKGKVETVQSKTERGGLGSKTTAKNVVAAKSLKPAAKLAPPPSGQRAMAKAQK